MSEDDFIEMTAALLTRIERMELQIENLERLVARTSLGRSRDLVREWQDRQGGLGWNGGPTE